MSDKMIRFLKSIGIENIDDFDLEFEMINRNRFNNEQWDMIVVKETPWEYYLLDQFLQALHNVSYKYFLRLTYRNRPNELDTINLFTEWYRSIYHISHDLKFEIAKENVIHVIYKNEEHFKKYSAIVNDFKDFLAFINYEFVLTDVVKNEDTTEISKEEMDVILNKAEKETAITIEEHKDSDTSDSLLTHIEKEKQKEKDIVEQAQDAFLEVAKNNSAQMQKERERFRLNKRGDYNYVETIDSITPIMGNVDINGKVFSIEEREYNGYTNITIGLGDDLGGAIYVKFRDESAMINELKSQGLDKGANLRVRGAAYADKYNGETTIKGHYLDILPPEEIQPETSNEHRVELHLHTTSSALDGVTSIGDYVKYAKALGHDTIAITDHAVVQGYPEAQKAAKKAGMKMIYGCELYVVDNKLPCIFNPTEDELNNGTYVCFDLETTGLSCRYNKIIEFGAVKVVKGLQVDKLDILINPETELSEKISELTGITQEMLEGQPTIKEVMPRILEFIKDSILVSHNASFDYSFLQENLANLGYSPINNPVIDTLSLSRLLFPENKIHRLGAVCKRLDIYYSEDDAHRADYDASILNEAWQSMLSMLISKYNINKHKDLANIEVQRETLGHLKPYHVVALVKNMAGLKDLYKLVSLSHTDYFAQVAKTPAFELEKARKNLLLGSACFNGEVFEAASHYSYQTLLEAVKKYDYIEIQPLENYSYLVKQESLSEDDILLILKDIVKAADELGKPVVATGDAHYLTPKEKKFRDVYIYQEKPIIGFRHPLKPYGKIVESPNQHFRSTDEMLECMSFLGEEKAKEVVIKNSNMIANMCEAIIPLPNDTLCTPKMSEEEMREFKELVFNTAYEKYGNPLPELIQNRLDAELNMIFDQGYAIIYWIAHKILKKTYEDGYLVGSRGSVGSSFVATMAGITEVNSLPPHYICPKCHHIEWTSETMPEYLSGFDLPEKKCPCCGEDMQHDGQNIPFETFLGFSGEKVPDIDLNFPSDYQARAHNYTKVLLGEKNCFRAGTIGTVADKTAMGYVRSYYRCLGIDDSKFSNAKIGYLASGCTDVKRTTGQHPGGIVVIPDDMEVYDFTPVQYPADDTDSTWKTTHLDYNAFHDSILKLDMLGHVDPLALKMMSDLTGIDVKTIPMNDPKVLSLFYSTDALNMDYDYLNNKHGATAIPEFGAKTSKGVLEEAKPHSFADLVILSGITHGKGIWEGNEEKLIKEGVATLRTVIGCRDDIMTYLIKMGLPKNTSFAIMEDVRKGRGLKPEFVEIMRANKVPQYYIDSCNKIKYMFPKGHAVAYTTQGVRVGYFKIYYPLEFYATFFSVRSDQFDIETMIKGKDAVIAKLNELKLKRNSKEKLTNKEDDQQDTLEVALEMLQRGYNFSPISLEKSDAVNFIVDKENKALIPPFRTLDGLGENNAKSVIEARKDGPFRSKEELLRRTKLTKTNVDDLDRMGVLKGLSEADQLTLFDF